LSVEDRLPVEGVAERFWFRAGRVTCVFKKWVRLGVFAAIRRELPTYYDGPRGIVW